MVARVFKDYLKVNIDKIYNKFQKNLFQAFITYLPRLFAFAIACKILQRCPKGLRRLEKRLSLESE